MIGAGSDRVRPYARRLRLFAVDRFETMASDGRKPIDRNTANGAVWRQRESVPESPKRRRLVFHTLKTLFWGMKWKFSQSSSCGPPNSNVTLWPFGSLLAIRGCPLACQSRRSDSRCSCSITSRFNPGVSFRWFGTWMIRSSCRSALPLRCA